jgi:acetylornithine deacetylase
MTNFETEAPLLRKLIAFDTVSHRPVIELANFLGERCADLGFDVQLYPDSDNAQKANLVCQAGPKKVGGLIVSGHMDVVPTEDQPWQSDPFQLTELNGKLYGRGTADMKGFIACTLTALSRIEIKKLVEPLTLIWTYDEEVGCNGSQKLVEVLKNKPTLLPKEALIGEPTDFRIFRMHPGHVSCQIIATGLAAHSSKPDLGISAIKRMQIILACIEQLEVDLQKETKYQNYLERPYVTLNVGSIKGGQAVNIVPDKCEIILGYRPLPGDDPLTEFEKLRTRLHELPFPADSWSLSLLNVTPALHTPEHQPLEKILAPLASYPHACAAAFATDGGNLAKLGIHSLIFGPGSIDVAHKANEFIEISALKKGTDIVEKVIRLKCEEPLAYF